MQTQLLSALFSLTILLPSVPAADIASQHAVNDNASSRRVVFSNTRLFPWLTWFRDEAVEFLFGRPSDKPTTAPRSHGEPETISKLYSDEVVLRFNLTTIEEEEAVAKSVSCLFLDLWAFTDEYVDIRLRKDRITPLLSLLPASLQESYRTLIPDVEAAVYESFPATPEDLLRQLNDPDGSALLGYPQVAGDNVFFHEYRPPSVIVPWMRLIEAMFPAVASIISIGSSYEGRDIPALKLSAPIPEDTTQRKTLVVTGGVHAREWISTTTVNYVAWSFVTNYGHEPLVTKFLEHFDLVFIPIMNPDGIEYTWQVDRLWRKTRQQTGLRFCRGLDLDRAFGFEWDTNRQGSDPCSESYGGAEPWEAVEAVALADWAYSQTHDHGVEFVGLIDLHSYSQQVMFPFSYTCDVEPPNLENLEELGVGLAKSIRLVSGESYQITPACRGAVALQGSESPTRIESGGGATIDWFYHDLGAHFSYQIKLRDTGSYGFLLPKEHIVPTGEEIYSAMKYLGDYLLGNNGIEHGATQKDDDHGSELKRMKHRR